MDNMSGKDKMLKTIGELDDILMQLREIYISAEGEEIPEEYYEDFLTLKRKITILIVLRKRLANYLRNEYGIFVMNGWEP